MAIRKAFVDGGVSYHHALAAPDEPLADFERLDVLGLANVALEDYDLLVVPRSADGEALYARRHQVARFLDQGGVLIAFGEQPAAWFPGSAWEPECAEDVDEPVITAAHPLLDGLDTAQLEWHPRRQSWCCHGHFSAPVDADLLRDGRYALHTFPPKDVDDEFYLTGRAVLVPDPDRRAAVSAAIAAQGTTHGAEDLLFEFHIDRAMHAAYTQRGPGAWPPKYTTWKAPEDIT